MMAIQKFNFLSECVSSHPNSLRPMIAIDVVTFVWQAHKYFFVEK